MLAITVKRLTHRDREQARSLFTLMAQVFAEHCEPLNDRYLERLLRRDEFWAVAAFADQEMIGGITAHVLPMTRAESSELFIYDLAVRREYQRQGVGRQLITAICEQAWDLRIPTVFVMADHDDTPAIDFYHSLRGQPTPVTLFTFSLQESGSGDPEIRGPDSQ